MIHAKLGASGSDRWMNCPGSIRTAHGLPDTTSIYAQEGTAAHSLAERALRKGLDCDVWLDTQIDGINVDEDMVGAVQVFVDLVHQQIENAGSAGVELKIEEKFSSKSSTRQQRCMGRLTLRSGSLTVSTSSWMTTSTVVVTRWTPSRTRS